MLSCLRNAFCTLFLGTNEPATVDQKTPSPRTLDTVGLVVENCRDHENSARR